MSSSEPIEVGCFGKVFGISGWIRVISFTEPKENILNFKSWLIKKNGEWEEFYFEKSKKQNDNIIVKLSGYDSPETVSRFTNIKIGIFRDQLPKLEKDEYYWDELIGLKVVNKDDVIFGTVDSLMATGSNDVLVVAGDKRVLIPYTSNVVLKVDLSNKIIQVDWEHAI